MTAIPPARAVPPPAPAPAGPGPVYWKVPGTYGYSAALDTAGTVAAPLLAGFAIALLGLVVGLGNPDAMPVRDPALATLVVATVTLLACVQCTFWAKQYAVTPTQILDWWPDIVPAATGAGRQAQLRDEQWRYALLAARWQQRSEWTYDIGILALLASLGLVLVPNSLGQPWRWLAVGLAGFAVAAELYWIVAPRGGLPGATKLFPRPADVAADPNATPPPYHGSPPAH